MEKTPFIITTAQQIKDILEPIPAELFQTQYYGMNLNDEKDTGKSCALGHIHRYVNPNDPQAKGDYGGYGARDLTKRYLSQKYYYLYKSIVDVNNRNTINGYTELEIKDRVMHLINHMIKDGY